MPGVLVAACAAYLLVLAGDYVVASADPPAPVTATTGAPAPVAVATTRAPARVVAAAAPLAKRPKPKPRAVERAAPAPTPVLTLAQTRAVTRAISRSGATVRRALAAAPATSSAWVAPVAAYHLTARFGEHGRRWASTHTGLDFAAPTGTPVVAVDAGVVLSAGWKGSYGQQVVVRHADGTETSYSHLSSLGVARGTLVGRGQVVGRVGATGNATGPHLHLEVRPGGGDPVDPVGVLQQHGITV